FRESPGARIDGAADAAGEEGPIRSASDHGPNARAWHALASGNLEALPRRVSRAASIAVRPSFCFPNMNSHLRAILSGALIVPALALAQSENVAPLILRLPSSARALAMGNVAVAARDDDVLFYNPAQLVAARGMSLSMEQFSASALAG